jgi:sec-independent protein translocase protein TatB
MFGVSFSELALIFVVALVVLGPKRLPGLVRKVGRWVGKARSMARDFQQQLENEINLDELNRMTEATAKQTEANTPAPPPESTSEPPAAQAEPPADVDAGNLAASGYPYGPQEPAPEAAAEPAPEAASEAASVTPPQPQPGDDTYSHAHAQGELPLTDEPAANPEPEHKKDNAAA